MLLSGRTRSSNDPQPLVVLSIQNNLEIFGIVSLASSANSKKRIRMWGRGPVLVCFSYNSLWNLLWCLFCHLFIKCCSPNCVWFVHLILLQCRVWATVEWAKSKLARPSLSHYPHSCLLCQSAGVGTFKQDLNIKSCMGLNCEAIYPTKILRSAMFLDPIGKVSKFFELFPSQIWWFFFSHIGADDAKPHDLGNLGKGPKDFQGQRIRSEINRNNNSWFRHAVNGKS